MNESFILIIFLLTKPVVKTGRFADDENIYDTLYLVADLLGSFWDGRRNATHVSTYSPRKYFFKWFFFYHFVNHLSEYETL